MNGEAKAPDVQPEVVESREGRRARQIKSEVLSMLEEVVELMESARKEGFYVDFTIPRDNMGVNILDPANVVVGKKW